MHRGIQGTSKSFSRTVRKAMKSAGHSVPEPVEVLCVGHAAFDLTMTVERHPGPDDKIEATGLLECGGGPAANAAVAVARLGGTAALACYLGEDHAGCKHWSELQREGVHTGLVVRGGFPTPLSLVIVKPDGSRSVINHKTRTPPLEPHQIDWKRYSPKVILMDGHEPYLSAPIMEWARRCGVTTVLDAGSVREGTRELAGQVDYLVASARFAHDFTRKKDEWMALEMLKNIAPTAVITLGGRGCIWASRDQAGSFPAFSISAVDTTGAGDVFHGAFALGIARQFPLPEVLLLASAAAAVSCTRPSARLSIPFLQEIEPFLTQRRLDLVIPPKNRQPRVPDTGSPPDSRHRP